MKLLAEVHRQRPRGRHLDDLLVAALDGAVALPQVHDVALAVTDDLDFNVTGTVDKALDEDGAVAEGSEGLADGEGRREEVSGEHGGRGGALAATGGVGG